MGEVPAEGTPSDPLADAHATEDERSSRQRHGFPASSRVRSGTEIRHLLRTGRRTTSGPLQVFIGTAPGPDPRFGTIVPKHGHRGVDRNLLRRRLREIGRVEVLPRLRSSQRPLDILVRTRREAYGVSFSELRSLLIRLTEQLCSDVSPLD